MASLLASYPAPNDPRTNPAWKVLGPSALVPLFVGPMGPGGHTNPTPLDRETKARSQTGLPQTPTARELPSREGPW